MKKFLFVGLAALVALSGCSLINRDFYRSEGEFTNDGTGSIVVILNDGFSKTIAPPTGVMVVDHYNIEGWYDGTFMFGDTLDGAETYYPRNGLSTGDLWTVKVYAVNAYDTIDNPGGGLIIGSGEHGTFTINQGLPTSFDVYVTPISGTGTNLVINLSWTTGSVKNPSISAYLVPMTVVDPDNHKTGHEISITPAANSATYTASAVATGYYRLYIDLYDLDLPNPSIPVAGIVDTVRIVDAEASSGSIGLTVGAGILQLTIVKDLQNPIDIGFSNQNLGGQELSKATAATTPYTTQADPTPASQSDGDSYNYQWYIDGSPVTAEVTSNILTLNSAILNPLANGPHALSVVLIERDAVDPYPVETLSSISCTFTLTN